MVVVQGARHESATVFDIMNSRLKVFPSQNFCHSNRIGKSGILTSMPCYSRQCYKYIKSG